MKSKGTTRKKAEAQRRLLNAIEHDSTFVPRRTVKSPPKPRPRRIKK